MKSPTKAIDGLWNSNFFRQKKSTKEVDEKLLKDFGITCTNTTAFLKSRPYLLNRKGWIQKYAPEERSDVQIVIIEPGKPRTATKKFEDVVKDLSDDVMISDPYLTQDCLDLLEKIKARNTKFLFFQKQNTLSKRDIEDFKKENPHIELRKFQNPCLHDRYILAKNKMIIVGHGLSLRNKETFIVILQDSFAKDLRLSLLETFNRRWKQAEPV